MIIGSTSAVLIIYDYYETHLLISKKQASNIALQGFQCKRNYYSLNDSSVNGELFHIKNNSVFVVDEKNKQDMALTSTYLARNFRSSEYVWEIVWDCYDPHSVIDQDRYVSFVDAKSGVLLK